VKRILTWLILLVLLAGCRTLSPQPTQPVVNTSASSPTPVVSFIPQGNIPAPSLFPVAWNERSDFLPGLTDPALADQLPGATIYHIHLNIGDDLASLTGQMEVRYTNQDPIALDSVYFRLLPNLYGASMKVPWVTVNDSPAETRLENAGSVLQVYLPAPLDPGAAVVIQMKFEVELPPGGGNGMNFVYNEDILALAQFYPMIPVYDETGWHVEIPSPSGDPTFTDPAYFRVLVSAPAKYTLVSSGMEEDPVIQETRQTQVFRAGPVRDFYLAGGNGYSAITHNLDGVVINSYTLPGEAGGASLALETAAAAIQSFSQRFAAYPYTEFDIVTMPTGVLGIEYPGLTAIRSGLYDLDNNLRGTPNAIYLESTVAHEVGHQWFYNLVGNDQLNEPWLDEAVTQYITGLYFLDTHGEQGEQGYVDSWFGRWDRVGREEIPVGMPVSEYDATNSYGAIVYGRGPIFLAVLSEEMGIDTFHQFLQAYVRKYAWDIADTAEFKTLAEETCQCNLTPLFEEWVYGD